jgi:hypothetical protein
MHVPMSFCGYRVYDGERQVAEGARADGWLHVRSVAGGVAVAVRDFWQNCPLALEKLNGELKQAGRPYLLIGPGRWGSRDPWLGIPVVWGQISGAGAIVEVDFDDLDVEPSQGSHFFHNLTSFGIPFLPVHKRFEGGTVNWEWLSRQPVHAAVLEGKVLHLQLDEALQVQLDGARRQGVVLRGQGDVTDGPR